MKNPNGYGTVSKISSGKRRKPYRVQITVGYKPNREKGTIIPIRKTIGYARTRDEGKQMLARYHNELFDLDLVGVSFEYLFNLWYKYKEKAGMAENTLKLYKNYYKHYKHLEDKAFEDITSRDLQDIVDNANCTSEYCGKIINMYNQMYEYAKGVNIRLKNKASLLVILPKKVESKKHKPFTDEEIDKLWNNRNDVVDEILTDIYSGVRPGELLVISEVHEDYFVTGLKTESGKNRVVPLNNKTKHIFHNLIKNKRFERYSSEDTLYQTWKKELKDLGMGNHSPYDCRHTFATLMARVKADEHSVKLIMGHRISDLTKRVYTHKLIEELIREVNKI